MEYKHKERNTSKRIYMPNMYRKDERWQSKLIDKELLYGLYFKKGKSHKEIAEELNVSTSMVSRYFIKYGFKSRKAWTKDEIKFLEEKYGILSFKTIGKRLGRTPEAIQVKAKRMKLGGIFNTSEYLTASELARSLNVDNKAIIRWIEKHELEATFRKIGLKGYFWRIKPNNFWKWAKDHQDMIKWSKMDINILGKEPKWVSAARKKDSAKPTRQSTNWTSAEDGYLKMYWNLGKTTKEIAEILNRTMPGVQRRARRIGLAPKLITIHWKPIEIKILKEMKVQGYTDSEVAEELGRDIPSVSWKRKMLKKSGELDWNYRG